MIGLVNTNNDISIMMDKDVKYIYKYRVEADGSYTPSHICRIQWEELPPVEEPKHIDMTFHKDAFSFNCDKFKTELSFDEKPWSLLKHEEE